MIINRQGFNIFIHFFFLLLLVSLAGCTTTEEQEALTRRFDTQLTLFLNGPDKASMDITFELLAVNIVSEDGTEIEVLSAPQTIGSLAIEGRQILLGDKVLPEGKYDKLRLTVKEALIRKEDSVANLALPPEGIEIDINVLLRRSQNTTLFLKWNADGSVREGYMFRPEFIVKSQVPELSSFLVYVTNEDSNNVSVINRQSGDIAATVMVGEKPRGIAISRRGKRLKVYVANSGSNNVSVIDPTTNKIENEIPIRFGMGPEGVAVATLSSGRELLFVTNSGSHNVSVVDTITYQELEKIEVGNGPIAIATDPPVESLVGTRFLSFEDITRLRDFRESFFYVYVVNRDSNSVSIIKMDAVTGRSAVVRTLRVEWRPVAVHVDYQRGKVYIANYDSDKLSVIDILQTALGDIPEAADTINNVGFSITGVVADPVFDRIYLLKEAFSEITIIRPFGRGSVDVLKSSLPPVMGTILVGTAPRSLILGPELRKLYVVNRGADTISVIDKTTQKEEDVIQVGRRPYGIAAFRR